METIINILKGITLKDIAKYPLAVFVAFLVYYFGKASSRNDERCDLCERRLDSTQREQTIWMRKYIESERENKAKDELYELKDTLLKNKVIEPAKEALEQIKP